MNLIWLLLRASWWQVAIAILTGVISGACTARLISLINSALSGSFSDYLIWYFAALASLVLLNSLISQFLLITLSQNAVYRLRLRLSRGILSSPLQYLEELGASRLLTALTEDVAILSNAVYAIPFLCIDISIIGGCLVYLGWLSIRVFMFAVGFMFVAVGSIQLLINKAQTFLTKAQQEQDSLFKNFRTVTEGIKELKLHAVRRQEFFSEELQVSAAKSRNYNVAALTTVSISTGWGTLLFFTLVALLLFGLPKVFAIAPSVKTGYILTITYLMLPLQSILDKLPTLFRASAALQKLENMGLGLASQKQDDGTWKPVDNSAQNGRRQKQLPTDVRIFSATENWTKLELKQVVHAYPEQQEDSRFILGPIDLMFYPGEMVFIIGANGSGKSTLAKMLTGLYIPETGEIRLDNKLITDENREWYRQHFSAVFSDFYLFEHLLGSGNPYLENQAQEYLRQLLLESKVKVKNGVLSTTELSQGQRKRLALLTVYLENRPIYLFDEWASDQDPFFRNIFYQQILVNLKQRGKTVVVISHDDRYFHLADRVIKLEYGKVEL